ncbi:hypothetical protein M501DRAFT_238852 [Patellaria atrata CBS 101060]|uniref:Uncharacterized protein n=1 Tax=Patellaria atrata CBS 101060 TaxID=1346257 RepID=A0A9P4VMA1_9PEZI|nr:hypothetical protein M501DRAFT_238852 [Patellaria atrata CBS 101060]
MVKLFNVVDQFAYILLIFNSCFDFVHLSQRSTYDSLSEFRHRALLHRATSPIVLPQLSSVCFRYHAVLVYPITPQLHMSSLPSVHCRNRCSFNRAKSISTPRSKVLQRYQSHTKANIKTTNVLLRRLAQRCPRVDSYMSLTSNKRSSKYLANILIKHTNGPWISPTI